MILQYSTMTTTTKPQTSRKGTLTTIGLYTGALLAIAFCVNIVISEVHAQSVYSTCQQARVTNTIKESTCGDLQGKYHYEYLCDGANSSPATHCYVEYNEQIKG